MQLSALTHTWYDPQHFHRKGSTCIDCVPTFIEYVYTFTECVLIRSSAICRNYAAIGTSFIECVYTFAECVLIRSLVILSNWISLMTLSKHILWMNKQIFRHAAIGPSDVSFKRDTPQHTCTEYAHTCTECVFILIECVLTFIQCVLSRSSLLCGDYAAIDTSDAGGMNLMDLSIAHTPPNPPYSIHATRISADLKSTRDPIKRMQLRVCLCYEICVNGW